MARCLFSRDRRSGDVWWRLRWGLIWSTKTGRLCRCGIGEKGEKKWTLLCLALEVKSGLDDHQSPGMYAFSEKYPGTKMLKIGGDGLPLEMFFEMSPEMLFHL